MSEKTALVRLRAITDDYDRRIQRSRQETERLAGTDVGSLSTRFTALGSTLTRNVTLPLVALGGIATKMAGDFDSTFTQMQTLAGVAAGEIDGMKESVLALAGETGRAPQELAEALYFIRSSGLDGAAALDALEFSAKGAAIGMGSTVSIADAVTSAINAYGGEALSAADATDVLVAAVAEGKAEPDAMAGQFGRLLPVASELGVTFGEVGGALAQLSKSSGSAELSATQLSGVMSKMLEPGEKGRRVLDEMGMSMDDLRSSIREKGLVATIEMLRTRLEAAGLGFEDFNIDQQFLQGALSLTGDKFDETAETIRNVEDAAGATDSAFSKWADSMGAENAQAFAKVQTALIRIGDVIAPIAADVLGFVGDMAQAFSDLPGPVQTAVIALGGLAALSGPLLSVGGNLVRAFEGLSRVAPTTAARIGRIGSALRPLAGPAGLFALTAVGVGTLGNALATQLGGGDGARDIGKMADEIERMMLIGNGFDIDGLVSSFQALSDSSFDRGAEKFLDTMLEVGTIGQIDAAGSIEEAEDALSALDEALTQLAQGGKAELAAGFVEDLTAALADSPDVLEKVLIGLDGYALAAESAAAEAAAAEGPIDDATTAIDDQATATDEATDALQGYIDGLSALFDPLFGANDALLNLAEAQAEVTQLEEEGKRGTDEYAEANRNLVGAAFDVEQQLARVKQGMEDGTISTNAARDMLDEWVDSGRITAEAAEQIAGELAGVTTEADKIDGRNLNMSVDVPNAEHTDFVLNNLARDRTAKITVVPSGGVISGGIFYPTGGGRIPLATGGLVPEYKAVGGAIGGPRGTDTTPLWATPGEFMIQKSAVDFYGSDFMRAINDRRLTPAANPGQGPVSVGISFSGLPADIATLLRKSIRIDAGGSAEVFFAS